MALGSYRLAASTGYLPAPGSRGTLERANYVGGDPTPVEVSLLRLDFLPPHPAPVHPGRVERDVVFQARKRGRRIWIEPGGPRFFSIRRHDIVVAGQALPLAVRASTRGFQMLHPYVFLRDVVDGRVACLENALRPRGVGERHAAKDDLDLSVYVLEPGRTRVVPDGLLSWTRVYSLTIHKNLLVCCRMRLYGS